MRKLFLFFYTGGDISEIVQKTDETYFGAKPRFSTRLFPGLAAIFVINQQDMFMIGVFIAVAIFYSLLFWYAEKCNREKRHQISK